MIWWYVAIVKAWIRVRLHPHYYRGAFEGWSPKTEWAVGDEPEYVDPLTAELDRIETQLRDRLASLVDPYMDRIIGTTLDDTQTYRIAELETLLEVCV